MARFVPMDFVFYCPAPIVPNKADAQVNTEDDLTISQLFGLQTIQKGSSVDRLYTHLTNLKLQENDGKTVECYTGKKVSFFQLISHFSLRLRYNLAI